MRKILLLAILAMAAGVSPALAQANCDLPIAPLTPNGSTVSQQQLSAAITDAKNFIAQSDVYQQCLLDYVKAQKALAAASDDKDKKPFDTFIETSANKKIDDNQKTKIQVGTEINNAVNAYKTAHPR